MNRLQLRAFAPAIAAGAVAAAALFAMPAAAAPPAPAFRAVLVSPVAQPRQEIVDGVLWRCEGTQCTGGKNGSRPVIVCGRFVQKFGPVASFAHPKGELDAEALARCNGG